MKAEMIKRIVRAIADGSQEDLERLAQRVVQTERERGHERLAGELSQILASRPPEKPTSVGQSRSGQLRELPLSRRSGELLVSVVPREGLEHHMVLPPAVEERFARIEREYAARERLGAYGLRNRKRILLYGPPGCGKSLGAQRLAWNTGLRGLFVLLCLPGLRAPADARGDLLAVRPVGLRAARAFAQKTAQAVHDCPFCRRNVPASQAHARMREAPVDPAPARSSQNRPVMLNCS